MTSLRLHSFFLQLSHLGHSNELSSVMQLFVYPRVSYCLIFSYTSFFLIYTADQLFLLTNDLTSWKTPFTNTKQAFILCFVSWLSVYFSHGDIPSGALCSPAVSGQLAPWAGGTALLRVLFNLHGNLFAFFCARYSISCAPCFSLSGFTSLLKWDVSPSNFLRKDLREVQFKNLSYLKTSWLYPFIDGLYKWRIPDETFFFLELWWYCSIIFCFPVLLLRNSDPLNLSHCFSPINIEDLFFSLNPQMFWNSRWCTFFHVLFGNLVSSVNQESPVLQFL